MSDLISRQDAKDRLTSLVNEIEIIFADIRERNVDDSVCGLCEYDCDHGIDGSAFECLGFERDDCFKLKDEYKEEWTDVKNLPSAQQWIPCNERLPKKPKNYPHCEIRRTYFLVSLESGCVQSLAYEFDRDEWQITASPVIAWMPLPEPWKGEEDED